MSEKITIFHFWFHQFIEKLINSWFCCCHFSLQQVVLPRKFRTTGNCIPTFPTLQKEISSNSLTNGNGSVRSNGTTASIAEPEDVTDDTTSTNGTHSLQNGSPSKGLLLTKQSLHTYQSNNHLVHYKYSAYSGTFNDLPK